MNPTYVINNFNSHAPLNTKTVAVNALQYPSVSHYNVHNLYGHTEAIMTNAALVGITNKRSFVLSRSTFASGGNHTAHWLGDNHSTFNDMWYSIAGIIAFNLFGIPQTGADICGFMDNTTEELCCRWTALGAFYPFSRNHNAKGNTDQEPYVWPSVTRVAIKTLGARYALLPYYYTLFYQANVKGGTVARGLFYEFPQDSKTYAIDTQMMIGSALLISPVLQQGATTVTAYFPPSAKWYNYWDGSVLSGSGSITLSSTMEDIQVHIRGGNVIPMQQSALTTKQAKTTPFTLLVALDASNNATGSVYVDDGYSLNVGVQATLVNYQVTAGQLVGTVVQATQPTAPPNLVNVTVLGVTSSVSTVSVNGASVAFTFSSSSQKLSIVNLALSMIKSFTVTWG